MKYFLLVFTFFILTQITQAQEINKTQLTISAMDKVKEIASRFTFGYSMVFLGPSLSSNYEENTTFNRFKTGQQDYTGKELDYKGSYQIYHATQLTYSFTPDVSISYSYTFQDDLYKVRYDNYAWDNSQGKSRWMKDTRGSGLSYNDQQLSMWISNIYSNDYFTYNMGLVYQRPTTEGSQDLDMTYGLGIRPNIAFNTPSKVSGLYTGISTEFLRLYYKKEQYYNTFVSDIDGQTYNYSDPEKPQTMSITVSPYLNYTLSDAWVFKSSLTFDWDQDGNEVYTNEYNNNMVNVGTVGVTYFIGNNTSIGTNLEFAIEEPSIEKTALSFNLNLTI